MRLTPAMCRFLSTPSARRATGGQRGQARRGHDFYPRPPRGGRLALYVDQSLLSEISIHALREEGDLGATIDRLHRAIFLSTPSARRATCMGQRVFLLSPISIHALREEGDACLGLVGWFAT